jgi:hypothetical protein
MALADALGDAIHNEVQAIARSQRAGSLGAEDPEWDALEAEIRVAIAEGSRERIQKAAAHAGKLKADRLEAELKAMSAHQLFEKGYAESRTKANGPARTALSGEDPSTHDLWKRAYSDGKRPTDEDSKAKYVVT